MAHRMHVDMESNKLFDIFEAKITAHQNLPEFDIKEGDVYEAEVWFQGNRLAFVKRLSDGKILKDERAV